MVAAVEMLAALSDIDGWVALGAVSTLLLVSALIAWRGAYTNADSLTAGPSHQKGGVRTVRKHMPSDLESFAAGLASTEDGVSVRAMFPPKPRLRAQPEPSSRRTSRLRRGQRYSIAECRQNQGDWWLRLEETTASRRFCTRAGEAVSVGWLRVERNKHGKPPPLEIVEETAEEAPQAVNEEVAHDLCYYCRQLGHWKQDCNLLKRDHPELSLEQRASWVQWGEAMTPEATGPPGDKPHAARLADILEQKFFRRNGRHFARPEMPLTRAVMWADTVVKAKVVTNQDWMAWDGKALSIPHIVQLCEDAQDGLLPYRVKGHEPPRIKQIRANSTGADSAKLYKRNGAAFEESGGVLKKEAAYRVTNICKMPHDTVRAASVWWLELEPKKIKQKGLDPGWIQLREADNPFDVVKPLHWENNLRSAAVVTETATNNFNRVRKMIRDNSGADTSTTDGSDEVDEAERLQQALEQQRVQGKDAIEYSEPTNIGVGERTRSGKISRDLFVSDEREFVIKRRELLEQIGENAPPEKILSVHQSLLENRKFRTVQSLHEFLAKKGRLSWKGSIVNGYSERHPWLSFTRKSHFFPGCVQALFSLPATTLEQLFGRLDHNLGDSWGAWLGGGGLVNVLTVFSIIIPHFLAGKSHVFILLWFVVVFFILCVFIFFTKNDIEWADIFDFLHHREIRPSRHNMQLIVFDAIEMLQLLALSFRIMPTRDRTGDDEFAAGSFANASGTMETELSDYQEFKISIKTTFESFLLDFQDIDIPFMYPWSAAAIAITIWWAVYGGLLLSITMNISHDTRHVQQRYQLYRSLEKLSHFGFTLLSDSLMIVILTQLWRSMDCSYNRTTGVYTLDADPDWQCWGSSAAGATVAAVASESDCCFYLGSNSSNSSSSSSSSSSSVDVDSQPWLAATSLIMILYYVFTATLLAPFVEADSDGIFHVEMLDIRFSARFKLTERAAKQALTALTIFFGTNHPALVLLLQYVIYSFLQHLVQETKPCSIVRMNIVKSAIYSLASFSTLCILLDLSFEGVEQLEWWPLVVYVVGIAIYVATHVRIWSRKQYSVFAFPKSKPMMAKHPHQNQQDEAYQQATVFNDAASLRGFGHRLRAIRLQTAWRKRVATAHCARTTHAVVDCLCPYCLQTRIIGLACEIEMDGYKAWTPIHTAMKLPAEWRNDGWMLLEERLDFDHANLSRVVGVALDFIDVKNSGGRTRGGARATPSVEEAVGLRLKVQAEENVEYSGEVHAGQSGNAYEKLAQTLCRAREYDADGDTIDDEHGMVGHEHKTLRETLSTKNQNVSQRVYSFGRFSQLIASHLKQQQQHAAAADAATEGGGGVGGQTGRVSTDLELSQQEITSWVEMDDSNSVVCAFFGRFSWAGLLKLGMICQKSEKNVADGTAPLLKATNNKGGGQADNGEAGFMANPIRQQGSEDGGQY